MKALPIWAISLQEIVDFQSSSINFLIGRRLFHYALYILLFVQLYAQLFSIDIKILILGDQLFVCLCVPIGSIHFPLRLSIVFQIELNDMQLSKFSEIRKE